MGLTSAKKQKADVRVSEPAKMNENVVVNRSASRSNKPKKATDSRQKLIDKYFLPGDREYLNNLLGIDLASKSIPDSVIYDIAAGRTTKPIEAVVKPVVYDRDTKENLEAKPLDVVASFRIFFPHDSKTHKRVAIDENHRPFISSYPCFDFLVKPEAGETATVDTKDSRPVLTPDQMSVILDAFESFDFSAEDIRLVGEGKKNITVEMVQEYLDVNHKGVLPGEHVENDLVEKVIDSFNGLHKPEKMAILNFLPYSEYAMALSTFPEFKNKHFTALESVGFDTGRLYADAHNRLTLAQKCDMLLGKPFDVDGSVKINDDMCNAKRTINVSGHARLLTLASNRIGIKYEPQYPVSMKANETVDLFRVRHVGNLELDFYKRDGKGRIENDIFGVPEVNQAAKDLLRYGVAFEPVDGFLHVKEKGEDKVTKGKYQVSLINGGICATRMVLVEDLTKDGKPIMITRNGNREPRKHYEIDGVKVTSDGKISVGFGDKRQLLEPVSEKDLDNYRRGRGGFFKDYHVEDKDTGKKVTYNVFAVPDNLNSGFPKVYSERVSKEMADRIKQEQAPKRKQNYSTGMGF